MPVNKEVKKYLKEVKGYLLCDSGTKQKFIADFERDLNAYIAESQPQGIAEIRAHFGEADEIAKAFLAEMNIKEVKKKLDARRAVTKVAIAVAIAVLLVWAGGITYALHKEYHSPDSWLEEAYDSSVSSQNENNAIEHFEGDIV